MLLSEHLFFMVLAQPYLGDFDGPNECYDRSMENLSRFWKIMTDRQTIQPTTDQPTDEQTDELIRKIYFQKGEMDKTRYF